MKVLLVLAALAVTILAHSKDFAIKLRHDGPIVMGGKINFIAKLYEQKALATGSFKFEWEDNTLVRHTAIHTSDSPVDVWSMKYSSKDVPLPGKYVATVTAYKQYDRNYRPVARMQIRFEIKGTSKDGKKPHPVVSQSWMDYKREKILNSQARELESIKDPRVRSIVSNRIRLINQRIPIMSTTHQAPNKLVHVNDIIDYKRNRIHNQQQRELDSIGNPLVKSLVNSRINRINSRIPIMQDSFRVPMVNKYKMAKEVENPVVSNMQKDPKTTTYSVALDAIDSKMDKLNEKMKTLKAVESESDVTPAFSLTLDAINKKMMKLNDKMQAVKALKDLSVADEQKPAQKKKRKVPDLSSEDNVTPTFSSTLDLISKKMDKLNAKMEAIKKIKDSAVDDVKKPTETDLVQKKKESDLLNQDDATATSVDILNTAESDLSTASTNTFSNTLNDISNNIETLSKSMETLKDYSIGEPTTKDDTISNQIDEHDKKIEELKEVEDSVVNSVKEPTVKDAVVGRIKEENKRMPYLSSADDVSTRFSGALDAIHERMDEIQKSQMMVSDTIQDAVVREATIKQIEEENAMLESKAKELDAQLALALEDIHQKMIELKSLEDNTLNEVEDPIMKENVRVKLDTQNDKIPDLLDDVPEVKYPTPLEEVSSKIGELELAEWTAIESIDDPIVREVILQNLNEHNQQIPTLLNSTADDATLSKSVDEVRVKTNEDVAKAKSDTQEAPSDQTTTEKTSKLEEIETTLIEFLSDIKNKLAALKEFEKKVVDDTPSVDKEKVIETVEEHNKEIPNLLLPSVVETNFTKALDKLNDRMANISSFLDTAATNITNPFALSILQSKMALVNYKLASKYNQIKANFTALLDNMATETEEESADSNTAAPKRPKLMLGAGVVLPPISDLIAQKMAAKAAPLGMLTADPEMQQAILDKMAARNQMIAAKANLIQSNMAMAMALIRSKVAALQALEDAAVEDIADPDVKEEVQASIDEENTKVPLLLLPYGIETNFTTALDDFQNKINSIKDSVNIATGNISIPAIRSMVTAKFDFVNQILKNKYDQLDSNFTAIMSKIQSRFANLTDKTVDSDVPRKVPVLTKTMGPAATFDLTQISDLLRSKMANKFAFASSATAGIMNATVRQVFLDKINEKSKNMTTVLDKLSANFTKIMEAINNKTQELQDMETLTLDSIDDPKEQMDVLAQIETENRKIPTLTLSKRSDKKKKDEDDEDDSAKPTAIRFKRPYVIRF